MVKVKICGITNLADAQAALKAGADGLGFVFYKKSPRYILPEKARRIIKSLPKKLIKVGVFVDEDEATIRRILKTVPLNMLQFHGNEASDFCAKFAQFKIIKAFRIRKKIKPAELKKYNVFAYLFDSFKSSIPGGTGKKFNWELIRGLKRQGPKVFLSGGLNLKNIKTAIRQLRPDWVDVSSSLESAPGKKNHRKMKKFVQLAKSN